jgi:hypothetical protein
MVTPIFVSRSFIHLFLFRFLSKVSREDPPPNWSAMGGKKVTNSTTLRLTYKFVVDVGFQTAPVYDCGQLSRRGVPKCPNHGCEEGSAEDEVGITARDENGAVVEVKWRGKAYKVGTCVLVGTEGRVDETSAQESSEDVGGQKGRFRAATSPLEVGSILGFRVLRGKRTGNNVTAVTMLKSEDVMVNLRMFDRLDEEFQGADGKLFANSLRWSDVSMEVSMSRLELF